MDLQSMIAGMQQQGGNQGMAQGQAMGQPQMGGQAPMQPQGGMPQGQPQVDPQQMAQMRIQAMWQKANSGGNIRGVPQTIFQELPAPTQKSLLQAPPNKVLQVFDGLQKDESYINALHSNDVPAQKKRVEAYLKAFNLYDDIEKTADNAGQI